MSNPTGSILLRRGPTTDRIAFCPLQGEIIYDSDQKQVFIGDGQTYGGLSVFDNKVLLDNSGNLTITGLVTPVNPSDATPKSYVDNIMPSQSGNTGKILGTNGVSTGWVSATAASLPAVVGNAGKILKTDGSIVSWDNIQSLTIGTGLSGSSFNGFTAVTIAIDSTVTTLSGVQALTNKTITSPTVDGNATVFINTTDASNSTTAPVTFTGGVGITKKLYVGSALNVTGNISITGSSNTFNDATDAGGSSNAPVTFAGGVGIAKKLYVGSDLTIGGNFTVNGTTTTISSANLELTDSLIYLAQGNSANSSDIGIVGHYTSTSYQHTGLVRSAVNNEWRLFSGVTEEPSTTITWTSAIYDDLRLNALNAASTNFRGSTSGIISLKAAAVAGTTTITLPATSGNVVTTGDSGTVTNTMLAGSIDASTKITNISSSAVSFSAPYGSITSAQNNVQLAIQDLETRKATLAGPTFTGTVTIPTPATSSNTTVAASTAFVNSFSVKRSGNAGAINLNTSTYYTGSQVVGYDNGTNMPGNAYGTMLVMQERSDTAAQFAIDYSTGHAYSRGIYTTTPTFSAWNTLLDNNNYNSYAPTLTGTGASGSWGINITGTAGSAPASDVYAWAKAATKPSYTKSDVGLGSVDNTADSNKSVSYAASAGTAGSATNATNVVGGNVDCGNIQTGTGVTTGDCAIELGQNRTGAGNTYIDLHSNAGSDFDFRILKNGSTDTTMTNIGGNFMLRNGGGTTGGVYLSSGATAWTANSDERLKTDLVPIVDAIPKLITLRTFMGRYKVDEVEKRRPFLIAQDVQAVLPEAVVEEDDEMKTLGLAITELIPLMIAGFKEQQVLIESLTARLEVLENK